MSSLALPRKHPNSVTTGSGILGFGMVIERVLQFLPHMKAFQAVWWPE
jgi:hypothetical protein